MSDDREEKVPEGMVSTDAGTDTNTVVGDAGDREKQTPDQFFTGEREDDGKVDKAHATRGMTILGYTEASRLENTAEQQERERKAAERRAAKSQD